MNSSDLDTLVAHRHGMLAELQVGSQHQITAHDRRYQRWARDRLRSRELVGLLAISPAGEAVASGCVWFREDQPRPWTRRERSPYIMSVYTDPLHRGRGLASRIARGLVEISRKAGYGSIRLNASKMGLPVYEKVGFERTTEMRYWIDPAIRRQRRGRH